MIAHITLQKQPSWEVLVRKLVITLLLPIFGIALMHIPAQAAPAGSVVSPMGVVLQAHRAQVGTSLAMSGATVFDGDALATETEGTLQVRFGGSQAYLQPKSSAVVHASSGGFGANLKYGSVILSSANGEMFSLLANGATIRPGTSQPTVGQVTWVNANELLLTSRKGSLEVSMDGDVKTVAEGNSYRMVIQPSQSTAGPGPQGSGTLTAGRNRFLFIAIALVGTGVGIGLWQALVSPSAP